MAHLYSTPLEIHVFIEFQRVRGAMRRWYRAGRMMALGSDGCDYVGMVLNNAMFI